MSPYGNMCLPGATDTPTIPRLSQTGTVSPTATFPLVTGTSLRAGGGLRNHCRYSLVHGLRIIH